MGPPSRHVAHSWTGVPLSGVASEGRTPPKEFPRDSLGSVVVFLDSPGRVVEGRARDCERAAPLGYEVNTRHHRRASLIPGNDSPFLEETLFPSSIPTICLNRDSQITMY